MKKLFGLLSVVLVAVICFTQPVDAAKKEKRAKYVFYFIGDGMGINQVNGTEMYLAERAGKIGVEPLNFTTFPVRNFVTTYSAYNSVTCSAAAGTALATGEKTKNGTIAMDKEHKVPVYSIATKAKELGMKVGIANRFAESGFRFLCRSRFCKAGEKRFRKYLYSFRSGGVYDSPGK